MKYDSYVNPSSDLRGEPEILRAPWRLHRAHSDGIPFKIEKKYTTRYTTVSARYTTATRIEYDRVPDGIRQVG